MEKNKKSWLKNLIFEDIEPENSETGEEQPASEREVQPVPVVREVSRAVSVDPSTVKGKVDQDLLNKLCAVLDQLPVEGIDYLKFKKSVDSLKEFQPEEGIRFTTAFVSLKATYPALTKESLIKTIEQYVALMEGERVSGTEQLKDLRGKGIDKREMDMNEAAQRVEKLKEEIGKLTVFISEASAEITRKKSEFAVKEADFNTTVDTIVNQLKEDKIKIESIIK